MQENCRTSDPDQRTEPADPSGGPPPAPEPGSPAGPRDSGRAPAKAGEGNRFRVTKLTLVYRYLFLGLLTLLGLIFLYVVVPMSLGSRDYLIVGIVALWALALLHYWVQLLDMPHRIVLRQGEPIEFVSLLRTRRIEAAEIQVFSVSPVSPGFLKIVTKRKKTVSLLNHITGLNEMIRLVREANHDLETKGC